MKWIDVFWTIIVVHLIPSVEHLTHGFLLYKVGKSSVVSRKVPFVRFTSSHHVPREYDYLINHLETILGPSNTSFHQQIFRTISIEHHQSGMAHELLDYGHDDDWEPLETVISVTEYRDSTGQRVAILTDTPIVNSSQLVQLRDAATQWWKTNSTISRYTYRRSTNLEVHLLDICKANETILHMTRHLLRQTIYPIIRNYFSLDPLTWTLRLYDSLILRYDASLSKYGASLPWHRDLGLISVNILLNNDFEGGGTMFDSICDGEPIQSPSTKGGKVGHALFHESHHRHAAAPTTKGIRDIWVMFVTAFPKNTSMHHEISMVSKDDDSWSNNCLSLPPNQEVAIRLKMKAREEMNLWNRAKLLKWAIDTVPHDGEAWHHLGMTLHELGNFPREVRACLSCATKWIPNDAGLFHNFAIVLAQQQNDKNNIQDIQKQIEVCFQRSLILKQDNLEYDTTVFNYATFLTHHGRWEEAYELLQMLRGNYEIFDGSNLNSIDLDQKLSELKQLCYNYISSQKS